MSDDVDDDEAMLGSVELVGSEVRRDCAFTLLFLVVVEDLCFQKGMRFQSLKGMRDDEGD